MSVKRIYVEKMADYAVEAKNLLWEIRHILQIQVHLVLLSHKTHLPNKPNSFHTFP